MSNVKKKLIERFIELFQSPVFAKSLIMVLYGLILVIPFCSYRSALKTNNLPDQQYERSERVNENKSEIKRLLLEYFENMSEKI